MKESSMSCQKAGIFVPRWGSPQRMGLPVVVWLPWTTQLLLAAESLRM
jgi:hypothetical protein